MAPLYHATEISNILKIKEHGIEPKTNHLSSKIRGLNNFSIETPWEDEAIRYAKGVSTTRRFEFAKDWRDGVILELDQQKIAQRYKIVPFQYWQRSNQARPHGNESEEFIVTTKPIPFSYVSRIYIPKILKQFDFLRDHLESVISKIKPSFIVWY